jgi:hypothetical protein
MIVALLLAAPLAAPAPPLSPPQNIVRTPPSEHAAQAGQMVEWRDSLTGALEESKSSGKPVFWYVTGTDRTFMDRKGEVDWLMMAGPFSWPVTVELINQHFIPVRGKAGKKTGEKYGIVRIEFIEPGWIVLDGDGKELARRDRLNTLHPGWFGAPLAELVDADWTPQAPYPGTTLDHRTQARLHARFVAGVAGDSALSIYAELTDPNARAEALYVHACALHDLRQEEAANAVWAMVAAITDHPLAAAAQMEIENHGPYSRGMASFAQLPADVYPDSGAGSQAPAGALNEKEVWMLATRFLMRMQRANGGWEDSIYDFGGTDSLPNVYVATSALVMQALLEAESRGLGSESRPVVQALMPGHKYVIEDVNMALEDADEIVWAYLYRAQFLSRRLADKLPEPIAVRTRMDLRPNPFVTAQALVTLHRAQQLGISPDGLKETVARGIDALRRARTSDIAYTYGMPRGTARAAVAASVGRAPLGELALHLWGADDADLAGAVERSFRDEQPLLNARKYDDHTNVHAYGGFFFWWDLHVRTLAIAALEDGPQRREWAQRQKAQVIALAEIDGETAKSAGRGRRLRCCSPRGPARRRRSSAGGISRADRARRGRLRPPPSPQRGSHRRSRDRRNEARCARRCTPARACPTRRSACPPHRRSPPPRGTPSRSVAPGPQASVRRKPAPPRGRQH